MRDEQDQQPTTFPFGNDVEQPACVPTVKVPPNGFVEGGSAELDKGAGDLTQLTRRQVSGSAQRRWGRAAQVELLNSVTRRRHRARSSKPLRIARLTPQPDVQATLGQNRQFLIDGDACFTRLQRRVELHGGRRCDLAAARWIHAGQQVHPAWTCLRRHWRRSARAHNGHGRSSRFDTGKRNAPHRSAGEITQLEQGRIEHMPLTTGVTSAWNCAGRLLAHQSSGLSYPADWRRGSDVLGGMMGPCGTGSPRRIFSPSLVASCLARVGKVNRPPC